MAFALLLFIASVSLSPPSLRPGTGSVLFERWAAFAAFGSLLSLGYPKALCRCIIFAIFAAVGLELLQELVPGRHGRLADAVVKASGAVVGVGLVATILFVVERIRKVVPK